MVEVQPVVKSVPVMHTLHGMAHRSFLGAPKAQSHLVVV
jgi:hypothetical protein